MMIKGRHPGDHPLEIQPIVVEAKTLVAQIDSITSIMSAYFAAPVIIVCFFLSPLKSQIRVVLGQQNINVTGPNTKTFGVEEYIFPRRFSVFNPTLHDIGNP